MLVCLCVRLDGTACLCVLYCLSASLAWLLAKSFACCLCCLFAYLSPPLPRELPSYCVLWQHCCVGCPRPWCQHACCVVILLFSLWQHGACKAPHGLEAAPDAHLPFALTIYGAESADCCGVIFCTRLSSCAVRHCIAAFPFHSHECSIFLMQHFSDCCSLTTGRLLIVWRHSSQQDCCHSQLS